MSMFHSRRVAGVATAAIVVAGLLSASVVPAGAAEFCAGLPMADADGLEIGDPVTGLTTTRGTDPTSGAFTGTFVGTLEDGLISGKDLLLFELDSTEIRKSGIWAGMSGSPVYDESGALIGAVSYAFSTETSNIAGVTPAAYMKQITPGAQPATVRLDARERRSVAKAIGSPAPTSGHIVKPVKVVAGANVSAANKQAAKSPLLKSTTGKNGNFVAAGVRAQTRYPIQAGGNIATSFSYGTVVTASVGTVTAVCGNQVYAFGHPDEFSGVSTEAFHGAETVTIIPNAGESYKMANIGAVEGVINQDRIAGIQGTVGAVPKTIPVTSTTKVGSTTTTSRTNVVVDAALSYVVATQMATDAITKLDQYSSGDAAISWQIDFKRANGTSGRLTNYQRRTSLEYFPDIVGYDVASDVETLLSNPFEDISITGVRINSTMSADYRAYTVSGLSYLSGKTWKGVRDGGSVRLTRGKKAQFRVRLTAAKGSKVPAKTIQFSRVAGKVAVRGSLSVSTSTPMFLDEEDEFSSFLEAPGSFEELLFLLDSTQPTDRIWNTMAHVNKKGGRFSRSYSSAAGAQVTGGWAVRLKYRR